MNFSAISIETLRFLWLLQKLSASSGEFLPFSGVKLFRDWDCVVYDDGECRATGEGGRTEYRVVLEACLEGEHHDIVSYYDDHIRGEDYEVRAVNMDGEWWCEVRIGRDVIVVRDGAWHFV